MPFACYPLRTGKGFAVKTWGRYGWDLGTTAKECLGSTWKDRVIIEDGSAVEQCFTFPYFGGKAVIEALLKIDSDCILPVSVSRRFNVPKEAKRLRVPYRRELFLGDSFFGAYQEAGIKKIISWNRHALFWEMRMGKNPALLAGLNHHWVDGRFDKLLFLGPPEAIYEFKRALQRWSVFYPEEPDAIYVADPKHREPFQPQHRIVLMTYGFLYALMQAEAKKETGARVAHLVKNRLTAIEKWGTTRCLVTDESHSIKNAHSTYWKSIKLIKKHFEFRYVLTGTPVPQGMEDLWTQMTLLDSGLSYAEYGHHVRSIAVVDGGRTGFDDNIVERIPEKEFAWYKSVEHLISREIKPDRIEKYIANTWAEPSDKQMEIYQALIDETLLRIMEEQGEVTVRSVENLFPHFSLALDNPGILQERVREGVLVPGPKLSGALKKWNFSDHGKLPMLDLLIEKYLEQDGEPKLVIWSGHPATLDALGEYYSRYNPVVAHGQIAQDRGQSKAERNDALVEKFKSDPKKKILFASYLVLNASIDLSISHRAIFFDRPWNWAKYSQSLSRIFLEPKRPIIINPLVFVDTLEVEQDQRLSEHSERNISLGNEPMTRASLQKLFRGLT